MATNSQSTGKSSKKGNRNGSKGGSNKQSNLYSWIQNTAHLDEKVATLFRPSFGLSKYRDED
jgi:hypothetical protein